MYSLLFSELHTLLVREVKEEKGYANDTTSNEETPIYIVHATKWKFATFALSCSILNQYF